VTLISPKRRRGLWSLRILYLVAAEGEEAPAMVALIHGRLVFRNLQRLLRDEYRDTVRRLVVDAE